MRMNTAREPATCETLAENLRALGIAAGDIVTTGGPFAATGSPEILNVSFDYVMMIDTAPVVPATDSLVISEVMAPHKARPLSL